VERPRRGSGIDARRPDCVAPSVAIGAVSLAEGRHVFVAHTFEFGEEAPGLS
jgi:hypothetical protein